MTVDSTDKIPQPSQPDGGGMANHAHNGAHFKTKIAHHSTKDKEKNNSLLRWKRKTFARLLLQATLATKHQFNARRFLAKNFLTEH
jgi:hypothetical protein